MAEIATNENIECPGGMPAFLAYPKAAGRYPVVVLMHERYGLVAHAKDLARRCAADGYVVLAPNFFFKHPDQKALNAGNDRYDMTDPESVVLLKSALAALRNMAFADMSKVAVAGYCQTGRHPLVFAAEVKIQAVVVWYGAASKARMGGERHPAAAARRHHRENRMPGLWRLRLGRSHHFGRRCAPFPDLVGGA